MQTDDLITALSREPARHKGGAPTTVILLAAGVALFLALMLSALWLKPRADLAASLVTHNHTFLLKLIFTFGVVAAAVPIVRDLSVPGYRVHWRSILIAAPFVLIMLLALRELAALPVTDWSHHVSFESWLDCLWQVPALAIPAFVILMLSVRRLAPTNLVRTGAYVGLLAGAIGAVGYALHCHHDSVAFVALAYTVAILEMAAAGALIGPRLLHWS